MSCLPYDITGPIASIFWLDEELCSDLFLDGKENMLSFLVTHPNYIHFCIFCTFFNYNQI